MIDPRLVACAIAVALSGLAIWSGQASVAGIGFARARNPRMFWVCALAPIVLALTAVVATLLRT